MQNFRHKKRVLCSFLYYHSRQVMLYRLSMATSIIVLQQSFSFLVMLAISLFKSSFLHVVLVKTFESNWFAWRDMGRTKRACYYQFWTKLSFQQYCHRWQCHILAIAFFVMGLETCFGPIPKTWLQISHNSFVSSIAGAQAWRVDNLSK